MTRFSRSVAVVAALVALTVAATGCNKVDKDVVATVNDAPIKKQQIDTQINQMKKVQPQSFEGTAGAALEKEYRGRILNSLIEMELVEQSAKKLGVAVSDKEIDASIKKLQDQYGGKDGLEAAMKSSGVDQAQLRTSLRNRLLVEGVSKKVGGAAKITEAQMRDYYDRNKTQFSAQVEVKVRHILVADKDQKLAQSLLARVKNGEDFAKLAKQYSTDPGSKDAGGLYDWAPASRYVTEFGTAAEQMKKNEVRLVKTQYGWHVLQLMDRRGGKLSTYESVKAQIRTTLESQGQATEFAKYVANLRKKAKVEILDPALKKTVEAQSAATGSSAQ